MNLTIIFSFFSLGLDLPNHFGKRALIKRRRKNEFGNTHMPACVHTHTHTL